MSTDNGLSKKSQQENNVLVKSRQRVSDHGEVFTPAWLVENMLDLVKDETERIDSRFLEPACGSGNFLVQVLKRKLVAVELKYGKSEFEKKHYALFGLMCIYGIELLEDNAGECRANLLEIFAEYLNAGLEEPLYKAASNVLNTNIIQGDALTLTASSGQPIIFPEWAYLGKGKFQRRDFLFDSLTQRSSIAGSLFEMLEEQDVFKPVKTYTPMTIEEIAQ
jgi:hypothetical protein